WEDGGVMLAYNYEGNSHLLVTDRDYLRNDLRARGGANLASYNCGPATIASSSAATANVYVYPYTALYGTVNNTSIAPCDRRTNGNTSLNILPAELRHN